MLYEQFMELYTWIMEILIMNIDLRNINKYKIQKL